MTFLKRHKLIETNLGTDGVIVQKYIIELCQKKKYTNVNGKTMPVQCSTLLPCFLLISCFKYPL